MNRKGVLSVRKRAATIAVLIFVFSLVVGNAMSGAYEVTYVASETGFEGPDTIMAGNNVINLVNQRQDLIHLQLIKAPTGRTVDDMIATLAADPGSIPRWIEFMGGPTLALPGTTSSAGMFLPPGAYVGVSFLADENGVSHLSTGMVKQISVLWSYPSASVHLTAYDYEFEVEGTFRSGVQTVSFTNLGRQPHEVVVVKLAFGANAVDYLDSLASGHSGPPLGVPMGGIQGIDSGQSGFFTLDLDPGQYALICFMPDQGVPHFAHGMVTEFDVKKPVILMDFGNPISGGAPVPY